jgi:glycosyltransferase involved in cell wall biosynthesis
MTNTQPFFSVIIPTYNRAHLISKTINSVLGQSFKDFEIIVVDNKSTDNTVEILQPYIAAGQIRLFVQDRNYERARSRNKGFEEAKGKLVTLLDSDDIIYPTCLEDAHKYYLEHPGSKFFHCSFEMIDEKGKLMMKGSLIKEENPHRKLSNGNYISSIGVFLERETALKVRVDETPVLIGMEDYDFVLRLLHETGEVGFINKINCGVLFHPQRTVLTQEMDTIRKRVSYFVNKMLNSELFRTDFAPYKKNFVSSNHLYLCGAAAIRGLSKEAFGYWIRAAKDNTGEIFTGKYWRHFFVIIKYMF